MGREGGGHCHVYGGRDVAKDMIHGGPFPKSNCLCHVFSQAYINITKHFVFLIQVLQQPYEIGIMNPIL